jgi:hypothetical protein
VTSKNDDTIGTTKTRNSNAKIKPYGKTAQLSIADIVGTLQDSLGTKLTAYIAGVADAKMVSKWANGTTNPNDDRERILRDTHTIFQMILHAEDEFVARAWFIGRNPNLDDEAPIDALREGRVKDVIAAARAYADGS